MKLTYPFTFDATEDFSDYRRDQQGVPQVYFPHLRRWEYNPITLTQYGLYHLAQYEQTGEESSRSLACTMAAWLLANQREWHRQIGAWVYDFDLPFYGPAAPWISGMAQGQAISLLLRMATLEKRTEYEMACHRALRAFHFSVAEGGVCQRLDNGAVIFEEYPTQPPSMVLNGHLFALIGIHDYATYFDDHRAAELFDNCTDQLKTILPRYDTGYWNLYDLHPSHRLASPNYIRIHVQLMKFFATLCGDNVFLHFAKKWQHYLDDTFCRARYFIGKVLEKARLHLRWETQLFGRVFL